ncbi:succinate dehydrogenase subunit C [Microlunatus sagamiharensis]|uniref:Succinate dehydrogenase subunit C n=1 Tax=Microlunatus sagamiharensis TaxID=546874 RepID=A0A1H2LV72_9ACTN|nr:succinate dehydrogenase cytochrome b subunit [Microlunatus sagamiharensis]SDU84839.1 succinate dehydrogenase subunit C [Microlunatus sagamiharensis]
MATTTLTTSQRAARSTVALKALMAVSGIILIGYLLAHMYGNLKVFAGQAAFDEYAHHLRTIGEPVLPHTGLLWVIRVVLLVAVVAHAYAAFKLWKRNHHGRGGAKRYHAPRAARGVQRSYSSFTLRWGGIIIALFVIFHLLNFTWQVINPGGASDSPYQRVVNGFSVWWLVAVYTIAMLAVGFHLRHGTWSALTTLGANTSTVARHRLNLIAYAVAGVVTVGFLLPPFSILVGLVR